MCGPWVLPTLPKGRPDLAPIRVWTLGPTDATQGGVGRRAAARPEIEARQKGHFFYGLSNGLLDITNPHPSQQPAGPEPIPPPPVVLGDMQRNTQTATLSGRRPDSAPPRYRCKAKVKPVPTIGGPPGRGPAARA